MEWVAAIAARSAAPAADRIREIIEVVLAVFTEQMFRPGAGLPVAAPAPKGPESPFHAVLVEVENVVR